MSITAKQAFVLDNLPSVRPTPYKVNVKWKRERFELNGEDCTPQITSLAVKGLIRRTADGIYYRPRMVVPSAPPGSGMRL